jgi:hypothetical protein
MYSGYLIGGPCHGSRISANRPHYTVANARLAPIPLCAEDAASASIRTEDIKHYTYVHSEEYTEWGNAVAVFILDRMGALPRFEREKFIRAALTGDGKVRAVTKANQKIIWPECPDDWWENF